MNPAVIAPRLQEGDMELPASLLALLNAPLEESPPPPMYPASDGKTMADNSRQLRWIVLLYCNLCWLFRGRQDVAVHANMLWYVEEGDPKQRQAPDVLVIFGRPPGERDSYLQWQEDNVPVTVVVEILSPSNTAEEMSQKHEFYDHYGVEEYYEYNPLTNRLSGFRRQGEVWVRIRRFDTWTSPRLGVRFQFSGETMVVEAPDGQPFVSFEEVAQRWHDERQRADNEKQRADLAEQRADNEKRRAVRLAELSRKVRRGQATAQELEELERLEQEVTTS
jgi:Uma2 family endonuclease